jgi:hypothetical protein
MAHLCGDRGSPSPERESRAPIVITPDEFGNAIQLETAGFVWRQAIFRLATTKIPDTCCNFFLSSLVSLLLAVPKRSAEGAKRRPCQSPFLCGTCLQLQPDAPK